MRPLLAAVTGFVVALGLFAGGVAVATGVIMVDEAPRVGVAGDVADVWTSKPRPVDVAAQDFERIGPPVVDTHGRLDTISTAALPSSKISGDAIEEALAQMRAAHEEWCSRRDPATDSYRPYSGGFRQCLSPYSAAMAAEAAESEAKPAEEAVFRGEAATYASASGDDADGSYVLPQKHIRDCFSRYRSYRVEDNSYQPYGGGPRRQCE